MPCSFLTIYHSSLSPVLIFSNCLILLGMVVDPFSLTVLVATKKHLIFLRKNRLKV